MTQRAAFVAGDVLTASDVNTYLLGEGGAWTSFSPTVTQSGSVNRTVTHARYARYGRTIHFEALLTITGTGTSLNDVVMTLPVAAAIGSNTLAGTGELYDASTNTSFYGTLIKTSTTQVKIRNTTGTGVLFLGASGAAFSDALGNTDAILMNGTYEAAS